MHLSIVILTYNQCDVTLRCLASLTHLMRREDTELILVDNGSTDATLERVEALFPTVRCIRSEQNRGVAAGRNLGLDAASGRYLMLLDNDTIVPEGAVDALTEYLEKHPDVGLVAPRLTDEQGEVQYSWRPYPGLKAKISSFINGGRIPEPPQDDTEPFYVIGAAQLFRREAFEKSGPLDENIFYGPEDADFCLRIRRAGYKVIYHPAVTICHYYRRVTRRNPFSELSRKHIKALLYFWRKHRRL